MPYMKLIRHYLIFFIVLTAAVHVKAQMISSCGTCAWENEGFNMIRQQFILKDTASARMKVKTMKIALGKDSLSGGISMRNTNDLKCRQCMIIRYDEKGRAEFIFDNRDQGNGKLSKTQYVWDEQNQLKYLLSYERDLMNEGDTAYHLKSFSIYSRSPQMVTMKMYLAEGIAFSEKPAVPPIYVTKEVMNKDGKLNYRVNLSPVRTDYYDSTVYIRKSAEEEIRRTYQRNKELVYELKLTWNNHMLIREEVLFDREGNNFTSEYTYDSERRCTGVKNKGIIQPMQCSNGEGNDAFIRYDQNGLPRYMNFNNGGSGCTLLFFYSYY
ncbi:MAG: hypothetical protein Fur0041_20150 [Bacteroidia bacterium]